MSGSIIELKDKEHNYGIDMLKIVSMLMVTILHILGQGGVLDASMSGGKFAISWFLEVVSLCAVNSYGMISGYLLFDSNDYVVLKINKLVQLWVEVVFYGIVITSILAVLPIDASISYVEIISAALPVCFDQYWYFTAYCGVFLLAPWLNKLISKTSKKDDLRLIIIMFLLFSCYGSITTFWNKDIFHLSGGYCFLWLMIMYIFGAFIRKHRFVFRKIKRFSIVAVYSILLIITFVWKMSGDFVVVNKLGEEMLLTYTSPTMVGMSICLVLLFMRMNINSPKKKKIIKWSAVSSFAVYLIHVQPQLFKYIIKDHFIWITNCAWYTVPFVVLGVAGLIFIICIVLDKIRIIFFELIGVNTVINNLCIKVEQLFGKICHIV